MTPRVSVIVPTLDEARYLHRLLDSLRRQTVQDYEVIVADSASTDGTREIARAGGAVVLDGKRSGPGEGRNRGARAARGEVLLFADADCVLPDTLLQDVLAALGDGIVGGATSFLPEEGTAIERVLFTLANGYQRAMTIWGFPHNAGYCFFFRREVFERLGGIREEMLLNETHDLALRSKELGRFVQIPSVVQTSMRRFRKHGYVRTIVVEYLGSTLVYYLTGRTPSDRFRPKPAR